jgi:hypothetical protein
LQWQVAVEAVAVAVMGQLVNLLQVQMDKHQLVCTLDKTALTKTGMVVVVVEAEAAMLVATAASRQVETQAVRPDHLVSATP